MEHKTLKNTSKVENNKKNQHNLINSYLQPEFMQLIAQEIAGQPHIDLGKIEEIKKLILHNKFKLDPTNVAESIIKFESQLFDKSKNSSN